MRTEKDLAEGRKQTEMSGVAGTGYVYTNRLTSFVNEGDSEPSASE